MAGAAKVTKAEAVQKQAAEDLANAQTALQEADKHLEELRKQQANLEGELGHMQASLGRAPEPQQEADVNLPSPGVTTEDLESIVQELTEGSDFSGEAKKRLADGIGGKITEPIVAKRPRPQRAEPRPPAGSAPEAGGGAGPVAESKPWPSTTSRAGSCATSCSRSALLLRSRPCGRVRVDWHRAVTGRSKMVGLALIHQFVFAMGKGSIMTVNVTSWGSCAECLESIPDGTSVIALQEHHIMDKDKLASFQKELGDFGSEEVWAPAVPSGNSEAGTSAGLRHWLVHRLP